MTISSGLCVLAYFLANGITTFQDEDGQTKVSEYLNITGNLVTASTILCALISSNGYAYVKFRFILFDDMITIDFMSLVRSILKYAIILITIYAFSFVTDFLIYQQDSNTSLRIISSYLFQFYNLLNILNFSICLFWLRKSFALINNDLEKQSKIVGAWSTKHNVHKLFNMNIVEPFEILRINKFDENIVSLFNNLVESLYNFFVGSC